MYASSQSACIHMHVQAWAFPCLHCFRTHIHVHFLINSQTAFYPVFWFLDLSCTALFYIQCQISHSHVCVYILPCHITIKLLNRPTSSYMLMCSTIIEVSTLTMELWKQNFSSFQVISSGSTEACVKKT